jgi:hypothetical protein
MPVGPPASVSPSTPLSPPGPADQRAAEPPVRPAESPAATVVRLLRETHAWGADAFRLLVLYAPGWDGAQDIWQAIVDAAVLPVGATADDGADAAFLAAGARPFFERLAVTSATGQTPAPMDVTRRVLDLYRRGDPVPTGASAEAELHALGAELGTRIAAEGAPGRGPAVAFLTACGSGQPDAAQVFGLLARHVPSWEGERDLHEAIWRWGTVGRDGGTRPRAAPPTAAALAAAAERYFRRAIQAADAEAGGPYPADLERVVRRLAALYLPDDPRLRAVDALTGIVESRIITEIGGGPNRRRRRPFGLPVFTFTLLIGAMAIHPSGR